VVAARAGRNLRHAGVGR